MSKKFFGIDDIQRHILQYKVLEVLNSIFNDNNGNLQLPVIFT